MAAVKTAVKIIADEFGNMPAIEAMENIITVCLGRNISFDLYVQAYAQLNKLYGDNAKTNFRKLRKYYLHSLG